MVFCLEMFRLSNYLIYTAQGKREERERESESESESESERDIHMHVAILAQVLHLCLGACAAPLHRGGARGLTWIVSPGEPSQFPQRCLSRISDATLLKGPLVAPQQVEQ